MKKPDLKDFNLTPEDIERDTKKDNQFAKISLVLIICSAIILFFWLLIQNGDIPGSILITILIYPILFIVSAFIFHYILSPLFIHKGKKYKDYKNALSKYEEEQRQTEGIKEFLEKNLHSKADTEVLSAEKILKRYGEAMLESQQAGYIIARKKSLLPYSIGTIKQAYFIYVDALIKRGLWTQEVENNLVVAYSALDSFVSDEKLEEIEKLKKSNDSDEKMKYLEFAKKAVFNGHLRDEIYEYTIECHKKYGGQRKS